MLSKVKLFSFLFSGFMSFSFVSYANLIVSEVYFDGSDEYVEIYNKSDKLFSGEIILSGVKSSLLKLNTEILPYKTLIIGDNQNFNGLNFISGQGLSISDTKAIDILLLSGNKTLDKFFVSTADVLKLNNTKTAFQKIIFSTGMVISTGNSPGEVIDYTIGSSKTQDEEIFCKITLQNNYLVFSSSFVPIHIKWLLNDNLILSGKELNLSVFDFTGLLLAEGDFTGGKCISSFYRQIRQIVKPRLSDYLEVSEIHAKTDDYPEFIELYFLKPYSGVVEFQGLGRGNTIWSTFIKGNTGDYLVISKSPISGTTNIVYSSMSLLDKGETIKISANKDTIDTVYTGSQTNKSFYPKLGIFGIPTPGSKYLNYACKIKFQKFTNGKINLDTEVSDKTLCKSPYIPTWYVGNKIYTGSCNPNYFTLPQNITGIKFEIRTQNGIILCSDTFGLFYKEIQNPEKKSIPVNTSDYITFSNCAYNLSSRQLYQMVKLIKQRYSILTLKYIFGPVKDLFLPDSFDNYFNSRQLRQIVDNTMSRYQERTLKYIFSSTKNLWLPEFSGKIQIQDLQFLSGKNYKLVLSGNYVNGLELIVGKRKYSLKSPNYTGNYIYFHKKLYLPELSCLKLVLENKILDKKCYQLSGQKLKFISDDLYFLLNLLKEKKLKIAYSGTNINLLFNNHILIEIQNKPLIEFSLKVRKIVKNYIEKQQKIIKQQSKALKKYSKLYINLLKSKVYYYQKYKKCKLSYANYKKTKQKYLENLRNKLKKYKTQIKYLKLQIRQIKKFVKQYLSSTEYRLLLKFIRQDGQ